MKIDRNIRKYMKIDHAHEFAFIFYVLTCILNVWTCCSTIVFVLLVFEPIKKDARRKKHELWRYSDLQIFYQDPIGDQNDGWSEPPKCQSC